MASKDWEPQYTYKENKHYKKYLKEKETIRKKYPLEVIDVDVKIKGYGTSEERVLHKKYIKEVCDLIMIPDGNFQQMVWDTMSEQMKMEMERKTKSRQGNGEYRI